MQKKLTREEIEDIWGKKERWIHGARLLNMQDQSLG